MLLYAKNLISKDFIKLIPWIIIIFSIGTQPSDFQITENSLVNIFNKFRLMLAIITSFVIILFFFVKISYFFFKKENKMNISAEYYIYFLFLIYFFFQILGYFLNFTDLKNVSFEYNIYLIVLSFAVISYFFLIKESLPSETLKFFLFFLFFLICFSGVILTIVHISKSNLDSANYFSLYNSVLSQHQFFLNHELPRVTGISRTLSILNIFLIYLFFYTKKTKIKFTILFFVILLSILIFAFQSRGTILCYIFSVFFLIFLLKKEMLKDKLLILFFSIIFSYTAYETLRYFQFESIKKEKNISIFSPLKSEKKINLPFDKSKIKNIILEKNRMLDFTSSGRIDLWKQSMQEFNKKKIFGYGPQADRYLLKKNLISNNTNNVSNGFIYSLLCGGYLGFIIFLLIIFKLLHIFYKSLFVNKIYEKKRNFTEKFCLTIFLFFLMRVNIENSFAVFGIDFIIIFIAISLFLLENKNYNQLKL